jgi:hypothetical protein
MFQLIIRVTISEVTASATSDPAGSVVEVLFLETVFIAEFEDGISVRETYIFHSPLLLFFVPQWLQCSFIANTNLLL